eukprot:TRINITY_DN1116_c0_g2_i2.p2 TRINITY_DN1116_c0_g2~~TRINITY_DN1116_c0_g2_i2.p2  ORF type:complete len:545 (+),score=236.89 TRINITY_DN1116_c0_g2_i2:42-1637(+)
MRALLLVLGAACVAGSHVHVALGKEKSTLTVQWTTSSKEGTSTVMWGTEAGSLNQNNTGDVHEYNVQGTWYSRTAQMTGLEEGTKYYYKVGDSVNGYSAVFSVWNRKTDVPQRHILYGDMGASCAFTLCTACTQQSTTCDATTCAKNTSVGLVSEVDAATMFLHVGDFAYDFDSSNGAVGDDFMRNIEQVAARVPYMVSHGNHEDATINLARFIEEFRSQPTNAVPPTFSTANGVGPNTLYFSWDHGMVHYVSFSTELWYGVGDSSVTKDTFLTWLKADLAAANKNRAAYPWVVMHGHRELYSSSGSSGSGDTTLRAALEDILFDYGVDFMINGHVHDYERSWPTYKGKSTQSNTNPRAPIYVVTGAAGSHELHSPFEQPQPSWSSFRSNSFSYTRMMVYNASHIHWQQVQTDPTLFPTADYGRVIDDVWIVQDHHGPFNASEAPQTVPASCPPTLCGEHDRFEGMVGIEGEGEMPLWKAISNYKAKHGMAAWEKKLEEVLHKVNKKGMWEEESLPEEEERKHFKWIGDDA